MEILAENDRVKCPYCGHESEFENFFGFRMLNHATKCEHAVNAFTKEGRTYVKFKESDSPDVLLARPAF